MFICSQSNAPQNKMPIFSGKTMTTAAIICEFNPLHTGHKRLIDYAKTISDNVVCVMSGNFTQRGMPACASKYDRARHAILAGADLVIELPTTFAISSAEDFATGGVMCANAINADYLVFGSECGDIQALKQCAESLRDAETNLLIKTRILQGLSYPKAVGMATGNTLLDSPNNVLAVEYIKALIKTNSKAKPVTIARSNDYNCHVPQNGFASSTAIRNDDSLLAEFSFGFVAKDFSIAVEEKYKEFLPIALSACQAKDYQEIYGVNEGIENRFVAADKAHGYEIMMEEIKTKRYTRLKLQRIALAKILNMTKSDVMSAKKCLPQLTPLAVKLGKEYLLSSISTANATDELTARADSLYKALSGCKYPRTLQKI